MTIRFYTNKQINKRRWNAVLDDSYNAYVYAYSWYLDIMTPGWGALIADNYRYLMPLPLTKKKGFTLSLQPFYMQQLGIFSPYRITGEIIESFLAHIPRHIRYVHLYFNKFNLFPEKITQLPLSVVQRRTFELDLILPYTELYHRFSENTRRNIKAFKKHGLDVKIDRLDAKNCVDFYKEVSEARFKGVFKNKHFETVKQLLAMQGLLDFKMYCYSVNDLDGRLIAMALFIYGHGRIIYLLNATNETGKQKRAGFGIVNMAIESFAGNNVVLDFAGGELENMHRFYSGFNATEFMYSLVKINRLPFFLKPFVK